MTERDVHAERQAIENWKRSEAGEIDFRVVVVTAEDGPMKPGLWCSHTFPRIERGTTVPRRVVTLIEQLAGKRALLAQKLGQEAANLRPATEADWSKLLMLCAAGVPGYELQGF